jgi:hypothetical protein
VEQHQVRVLGADLVERVPDALVIVAVGTPGKGDARAGRRPEFGIGATAGREEVAAVDHRRGQSAVIDHRPGARAPGGTGRSLVELGRVVAEELEGVAALDQSDALADQLLELYGFDLGAVLLELAAALRLFVGVELALDAIGLAVEEVDKRPKQVGEIALDPRP